MWDPAEIEEVATEFAKSAGPNDGACRDGRGWLLTYFERSMLDPAETERVTTEVVKSAGPWWSLQR